jgi:hypothetical protein
LFFAQSHASTKGDSFCLGMAGNTLTIAYFFLLLCSKPHYKRFLYDITENTLVPTNTSHTSKKGTASSKSFHGQNHLSLSTIVSLLLLLVKALDITKGGFQEQEHSNAWNS